MSHPDLPPGLTLRPVTPDDDPFLLALYAGTRADELAQLPWDEQAKRAFVLQQFQAQQAHYQSYYPSGDHQIILRDGRPIGRLYLDRSQEKLHILDIALLPAERGAGLGGALMGALLAEADARGLPASLYVYRFDERVLSWYRRLGFQVAGDTGMYYLMERAPVAGPRERAVPGARGQQ